MQWAMQALAYNSAVVVTAAYWLFISLFADERKSPLHLSLLHSASPPLHLSSTPPLLHSKVDHCREGAGQEKNMGWQMMKNRAH